MTNVPEPAKGKSWRDVLPVHPAADLFPLMSPNELRELGEDIKKNGLLTPIVVWSPTEGSEEQYLLDGRNRVAAMEAAGGKATLKGQQYAKYVWRGYGPATFVYGTAECGAPGFDPYEYVLSANIHRRHLTAEQKREIIAKVIKAKPEASNRQIAKIAKASPTTVGTIRTKMEAAGDVSKLDTRADTRGRKQPARKKRRDVDDFLAEKRAREAKPGDAAEAVLAMIIEEANKRTAAPEPAPTAHDIVDQALHLVKLMDAQQRRRFIIALRKKYRMFADCLKDEAAPAEVPEPEPTARAAAITTTTPAGTIDIPDLPEFLRRTA
jgi:hypothetical protein